MLWSCHSKHTPPEDEPVLAPPMGMVFTLSGDSHSVVRFFNLTSMEMVGEVAFPGYSVAASVIGWHGDKIAVADARMNRVSVLNVPQLEEQCVIYLGGAPMDLEVDPNVAQVFMITHDGTFLRDSVSSGWADTLDVRLYPRRLALRPPEHNWVWITCVGNQTLHVVYLTRGEITTTRTFEQPPTDVQFSQDGSKAYIAFAGTAGNVVCYDADSLRPLSVYEGAGTGPFELALSDDGNYIAAADSAEGTVKVWSTTGNQSWSLAVGNRPQSIHFAQHSDVLYVLVSDPDKVKRLLVSPTDGVVLLGSLDLPEPMHNLLLWEAHD